MFQIDQSPKTGVSCHAMKDMSKESSVRQPPGSGRQQQQGSSRIIEARETFPTLLEISRLLNTGLDAETLAICVRLCEQVRVRLACNVEALWIK